jgi:hypothetical protein
LQASFVCKSLSRTGRIGVEREDRSGVPLIADREEKQRTRPECLFIGCQNGILIKCENSFVLPCQARIIFCFLHRLLERIWSIVIGVFVICTTGVKRDCRGRMEGFWETTKKLVLLFQGMFVIFEGAK